MSEPMWCDVRQHWCRCHDYGKRCDENFDKSITEAAVALAFLPVVGGSDAALDSSKEKPCAKDA